MQPYSNETLVQDGYFAHPSSFMETVSCRVGAVCLSVRPSVRLSVPLVSLPSVVAAAAVCADGDVHRPVRHGATVALRGAAVVPTPLKRERAALPSALACVGILYCVGD